MASRSPLGWDIGSILFVEALLEDGLHALVVEELESHGARACLLKPVCPISLGQTQQSETGPEALFRVGFGFHDATHHRLYRRTESGRPGRKPLRRPFGLRSVMRRHVLADRCCAAASITSGVACDSASTVKDLDRRAAHSSFYLLTDESVRDAVEMALHFNVIIKMYPCLLPVSEGVTFGGQGPQSGPLFLLEDLPATPWQFLEGSTVELFKKLTYRLIQ